MSVVKDELHSKQSKKKKGKEAKTEFQGFFTVTLEADDKLVLEDLAKEPIKIAQMLTELVNVGMKVSFIEQASGSGVMCSVYAARAGAPDAGWGFSAWAASTDQALLAAHYKFIYLIQEATFVEYMDEHPVGTRSVGFS